MHFLFGFLPTYLPSKIKPLVLLFFVFSNVSIYAQCVPSSSVSITGNNCIGAVLKATASRDVSTVIWKLNGTKTVATHTISPTLDGITIAGNNGTGNGLNQLSNPNRIYMDPSGTLYIPDMSNSRILKWEPGATAGVVVAGGNGIGGMDNQFDRPTSVFVDRNGNLFITDQTNGRVQKWTPGANAGITVASGLSSPTAVFIDASDNMYVSEQNNSLVSKWAPGATRGVVVAGGRGYGSGASQLSTPTGIFVDAAGNIYICDTDNDRIQKWAPGASSGVTVAGGNFYGAAANQLANPLGIYVDGAGNIYISDFNNYRVQKWAPGATAGITIAGGNGRGTGSNQLNQPAGITMDNDCNLYVADFYNHRILKFTTTTTTTYTALEPGDYTATAISNTGNTTVSNTITVNSSKTPQISVSADQSIICPGMPVTFTATITDGGNAPKFQWYKNNVSIGTNANRYQDNEIKDGDIITCTLTSNAVCLNVPTATSSPLNIQVRKAHIPVTLGADFKICEETAVTINAGNAYSSYLWNDASTTANLTIAKAGTYHVRVQDACGDFSSDTITVSLFPKPLAILANDTTVCTNGSVELKALTNFKEYLWNTNAATPSIEVRAPGTYWLQVKDQNNCILKDTILVKQRACLKRFYVPTSFTPNGDGKNDVLKPIVLDIVKQFQFTIYNRWGQPVFSSDKTNQVWDGKVNGNKQDTNVFTWICTYQFLGEAVTTEKGTITLIK